MLNNISTVNDYYRFSCPITSASAYPMFGIYRSSMLASAILNLVISLPTIILNLAVIKVILRNRNVHKPSNYLIVNTAICDLLVGAISNPVWSANLFMVNRRTHDCLLFTIMIGLSHYFALMSYLAVFSCAIDRYIAIFQPFYYRERIVLKVGNYVIISICSWIIILGLVIASLATPYFNLILLTEVIIFLVTLIGSFYIHIRIYLLVRKTRHKIRSQTSSSNTAPQQLRNKDVKIVTLTFLMLLSLLIFYIPSFIVGITWIIYPKDNSASLNTMNLWNFTIVSLKSLVNPVLYCLTISGIRKQMKLVLCIQQRKHDQRKTQDFMSDNNVCNNISLELRGGNLLY